MIALDENDKPVKVPRLILQTEDEHLAWAHGEERKRIRDQRRKDQLDWSFKISTPVFRSRECFVFDKSIIFGIKLPWIRPDFRRRISQDY